MGGIMGNPYKAMQRQAKKDAAEARTERQSAAEEVARAQQQGERGMSSPRQGRDLLLGNLGTLLKQTLGS
jgi:hypothetical protein